MSLQKYLQHELSMNLEGSNSLVVAEPGMGALAHLYTDIKELSKLVNESVTVVNVDATMLDRIGSNGLDLQDAHKIAAAKNAVLVIESDNATTAQINLVCELMVERKPHNVDISHAHVVLFTHDPSNLPAALLTKVTVFPENALETTINPGLKERVAVRRAEQAVCLPYDQHPDVKSNM